MNPLRYLRPAVFAALTSPAVVLNGVAVPVKAYGLPGDEKVYVLHDPDQDTATKALDGRVCTRWDCTILLDVVTRHQPGVLSVVDADLVADALTARLDHNRLALNGGLQVLSAAVETINGGSGFDQEQVDVHRYLRLRYVLHHELGATPGVPAPLPAPANAYPFANQSTVTVTHNLGRFVLVQAYDLDGHEISGQVTENDLNTLTIDFFQPLTGTVVLL